MKSAKNKFHKIIEDKNGKVLSGDYETCNSRFIIQCEFLHQWETSGKNILLKRWCKICAGISPLSLHHAQLIATEKNGKCLSTEYINTSTPLIWQCNICNNIWLATYANIKHNNRWCPKCGGTKKLTLEDANARAAKKNGKCLSTEYINNGTKMLWRCEKNHVFKMAYSRVEQGHWCQFCAGNATLTLDDAKEIAKSRGGKCLSTEYKNMNSRLLWQCSNKHEWTNNFSSIKSGKWCPECNLHISEKICREYFEQLFEYKFSKYKTDWLKNEKTGKKLELDGYCVELGIAFEHHGEQHYKFSKFFHSSIINFHRQINNDKLKYDLCNENNIKLIIIPQLFALTPLESLKDFIKNECIKYNITIPNNFDTKTIDLSNVYIIEEKLNKYIEMVKSQGGSFISKENFHNDGKITLKCNLGHIFRMTCGNINAGNWCKVCHLQSVSGSLEKYIKIVEERGGKYISGNYTRSKDKITWRCKDGHLFISSCNSIQQGHWCNTCNDKEKSLRRKSKA